MYKRQDVESDADAQSARPGSEQFELRQAKLLRIEADEAQWHAG